MLEIQEADNCSDKDNEYHKAFIKKNITDAYYLTDIWNNNFQELGSWEKFREVCTKIIKVVKNSN